MTALPFSATTRLRNALDTWERDGITFTYHLSLQPGGQDQTFSEILDRLNEVAQGVDESYRTWRDLERELDSQKDYANQAAFIELAIGQPVA